MKKALTLIAILCMAAMLFAGCSIPFPQDTPTEHVHTLIHNEEKAPTCVNNGIMEHWYCPSCNARFADEAATKEDAFADQEIEELGHTRGEDDGDCTTAIACSVCGQEVVAAKDAHVAGEDDGDCTTAVKCVNCDKEVVAAKDAHEAGKDDGNCTTAVKCVNCDKEAVAAKEAHVPAEDDGDVTTPVKCQSCDHICVEAKEAIDLTIDTFENGAVVTDKKNYAVGEKVTLTITPADGYAQKLYINDEPLMLGWKTNTYTFIAEKGKTYAITGSFEPGLKLGTADKWDAANQAHGILNTYYTSGDSTWYWIEGEYASISAIVKNYDSTEADGFFTLLCFKINNMNYSFRVIKQGGKYYCQRAGFKVNGKDADWTKKELDADTVAAILGEGVEFKLERTSANMLTLSVNGKVYDAYTLTGDAVNAPVTNACIGHDGNENKYVAIPFALTVPSDEPPVENDVKIEIPAFTNGTVATNKESYAIGDTATLLVLPDAGYYYTGLYIDGVKANVDRNGMYSFEVTKESYEVTCGFAEKQMDLAGAKRWDLFKHCDGELVLMSQSKNDWKYITYTGTCNDVSTVVKNGKPGEELSMFYRFTFTNGNTTEIFEVRLTGKTSYKIQTTDLTTVFGKWKSSDNFSAEQNAAVDGDGITFRVIILDDTAYIYLNSVKFYEYKFTKSVSGYDCTVGIRMDGNLNLEQDMYIPYEVKTTTQLPQQ